MVEAIISSEKVAVTFAVRATPVALAVGTVLMTVGGPEVSVPAAKVAV